MNSRGSFARGLEALAGDVDGVENEQRLLARFTAL
jgi:hypothetical protein